MAGNVMTHETFTLHKGYLCLTDTDTLYFEPVRVTYYWPFFRVPPANWAYTHMAGMPAYQRSPGVYAMCYPSGITRYFQLANGAETKPLDVVRETVPCPKVHKGIQIRWESGYWQKHLKSGWVAA